MFGHDYIWDLICSPNVASRSYIYLSYLLQMRAVNWLIYIAVVVAILDLYKVGQLFIVHTYYESYDTSHQVKKKITIYLTGMINLSQITLRQ